MSLLSWKRSTLLLVRIFLLFSAGPAAGAEVPYLAGRVNDNAGLLTPETVAALDALLKAHEDSTTNQVAVLTVTSLEGEPLEQYSLRVAQAWKLGRRGTDNGVLLLVAKDEREVRIEVGNGLEGSLPDILCGRIIRNEIVPRFRRNDYDGGIRSGVEGILAAIGGEYRAEDIRTERPPLWAAVLGGLVFILVVGSFTTIALFSPGFFSWFLYVFLLPFWFAFPVAFLGPVAGLSVFATYALGLFAGKLWIGSTASGKRWMKRFGTGRGGGALSSLSSGGSGGGFSGGGFSGGGGGFSGGGASGGW